MGIFREIPPTAGFPIYTRDLLALFDPQVGRGSLEKDFQEYLGVGYARVTYSGTAAFYLILETLKGLSPRKTVVIPSFICPLLPLAIKRAGLHVAVCDINPGNFNFDLGRLGDLCAANKDILAIVPAHLAGIPVDFDPVAAIAAKYGIFTIEDCAQSLGAAYKGKRTGALGDFSFFSLCRGKGLTIYEGGVLVVKDKRHAAAIDGTAKRLVQDDFLSETLKIGEIFGYWIFYRPSLFWFVFALPKFFWNLQGKRHRAAIEYFTAEFPLHDVSRFRRMFGHVSFRNLGPQIFSQRQKASQYLEALKEIRGVKAITAGPEAEATYPYLTLLFDNQEKREQALKALEYRGLGAAKIYALAIADYDYLKGVVPEINCSQARSLAARHLTLSTSIFLRDKDLARVVKILLDITH